MTKTIRRLHADDHTLYTAMDTGLERDYVGRVFQNLTSGDNFLYGLFIDGQLASVGGYTRFNEHYAMLGRLRSDRQFRGQDLATELMAHVVHEILHDEQIQWIGANTQEDNLPARRVLEKLGFPSLISLHGAITKDVSMLESDAPLWSPLTGMARKKAWLKEMFIAGKEIFPYECYYPFPASEQLFKEEEIKDWMFYENDAKTRCLIMKPDRKKHHYLHVIYPWSDFTGQKGLWETVAKNYHELAARYDEETYIWKDFTKEEASLLPDGHAFKLPSPWMLHGKKTAEWQTIAQVVSGSNE